MTTRTGTLTLTLALAAASALAGCNSTLTAVPALAPSAASSADEHFERVLTVTISPTDTRASLEARYTGEVVAFHPDAEPPFAILGLAARANSVGAMAVGDSNTMTAPENPSTATLLGTAAWAGGTAAWAGGTAAWAGVTAAWAGADTSITLGQNYGAWSQIRLDKGQPLANKLGGGVAVAVIDTGIDTSHPAFVEPNGSSRLTTNRYDFVDNDNDPNEVGVWGTDVGYGHGTGVAAIVLQVAPKAKIMALRALRPDGSGDVTNVVKAIDWAVAKGAQVINLSLGTVQNSAIDNEVAYATSKGVYVVSSSGNTSNQMITTPAKQARVTTTVGNLSVGVGSVSTITLDRKSNFSTYGHALEMTSPGEGIYTAAPGAAMATWSGTSFATPMVTGALALALGELPRGQQGRLAMNVATQADNVDAVNDSTLAGKLGLGRLNVEKFLRYTLGR